MPLTLDELIAERDHSLQLLELMDEPFDYAVPNSRENELREYIADLDRLIQQLGELTK